MRAKRIRYQALAEPVVPVGGTHSVSVNFTGVGEVDARATTEFDDLLNDQFSQLLFAAELSPWNLDTGALDLTVYAATRELQSASTDTPPHKPFFGTLSQPVNFRRSILDGSGIGGMVAGEGSLQLDNIDGGYDDLIETCAIDGRPIVVRIGRLGDAYPDDYHTVFSGVALDWMVDESTVDVRLRDNSYKLRVPALPNSYTGTGAANGGADLAGKKKPRAFGAVLNVLPPLVTPSLLIYQVNDGAIEDVDAVYDRGVALTKDADYASYATLAAASVPAGAYATSFATGLFRLGSTPSGTVTADVSGDKLGGSFVTTSGTIIRRLLDTSTELIDPADLYLPGFAAVELVHPDVIGYWLGPDSTETVADVCANIIIGIGGFCGFRRTGLFAIGVLHQLLFTGGSQPRPPVKRINQIDIKGRPRREPLPSAMWPPPSRYRVAYQRVWHAQTDLASSVTAARRAFVAEPYRLEVEDTSAGTNHPFLQEPLPVESYFNTLSSAANLGSLLRALYADNQRSLYRVPLHIDGMSLDIGDIIELTYPRWDLVGGKTMAVLEINANGRDKTVEVLCFG